MAGSGIRAETGFRSGIESQGKRLVYGLFLADLNRVGLLDGAGLK